MGNVCFDFIYKLYLKHFSQLEEFSEIFYKCEDVLPFILIGLYCNFKFLDRFFEK
jgi:hypothetical protein